MEITREEFFIELRQDIMADREAKRISSLEAFLEIFSDDIAATGIAENGIEYCHYQPSQGGVRVDGYHYEADDKILSLFIADYDDRPEITSLTRTELDATFKRLSNFFEGSIKKRICPKLEITSEEYKLSKMIEDKHFSFIKVNFFVLSERRLSDRVKELDSKSIADIPVYYHVWDIERRYQQYLSKGQKEPLDLDLEELFQQTIPCLHANLGEGSSESYLAVVPGEMLASLYERYDSRLLEQNVRTFLQARGNVNKGIRATILNEPSMFFAYNNGITATAQSVEIVQSGDGIAIARVKDLQIVNGGQTTASLFHTRKRDRVSLEHIFVQMKLSVVAPEDSERIVPKISQFANTQNKVTASDFFANHPFHLEIEKFSRRILAPAQLGNVQDSKWFYERARGQYAEAQSKLTPPEKRKFQIQNPKKQMFTKEDMAKYENVWEEHPKILSGGRQKNFVKFANRIAKEWEENESLFDDKFFRRAVARAIIFRATERIISSQEWYRTGGSIRSHLVYYSLACMAELAKRQKLEIPFIEVWKQQDVPSALAKAIAICATFINKHITNPIDNAPRDSEWFKRDICWTTLLNDIKTLESMQADSFWHALTPPEPKEKNVVSGVKFQEQVLAIPVIHWKRILIELSSKKLLPPKEFDILNIAVQIPKKIPSEKQSQILLQIFEKAHNEGIVL